MNLQQLKFLLLRYPTRSKYILLFLDIILVLIATKMFINYNNIEIAIKETAQEAEEKRLELAFAQNFQLNYEKSDYANYFLKHESNILMKKEFIIKFQALQATQTGANASGKYQEHIIQTPQESRKQFLSEKLFPKETASK